MKYREGDVVRRWNNKLGDYEIGVVKCTWIDVNHKTVWYKTVWYKTSFQNK